MVFATASGTDPATYLRERRRGAPDELIEDTAGFAAGTLNVRPSLAVYCAE